MKQKIKEEVLKEHFGLKDLDDLNWLKTHTPKGEFVPEDIDGVIDLAIQKTAQAIFKDIEKKGRWTNMFDFIIGLERWNDIKKKWGVK